MSFRRGGAKKRRDAAEPAIIEALKAHGASVFQISGRGLPDLLIRYRGRCFACEVKSAGGKRTEAQEDTQFPVVRTPQDAIALVRSC